MLCSGLPQACSLLGSRFQDLSKFHAACLSILRVPRTRTSDKASGSVGSPTQSAIRTNRLSESTGCPIQQAVQFNRLPNSTGCANQKALQFKWLSYSTFWNLIMPWRPKIRPPSWAVAGHPLGSLSSSPTNLSAECFHFFNHIPLPWLLIWQNFISPTNNAGL